MPRKKSSPPKGRDNASGVALDPEKRASSRSPVGRSPARAAAERDALGRLQTALTEPLLEELCRTYEEGDFANATAVRCGVHPTMLKRWLERGKADDSAGLYTRLFMAFGRIEGELRAEYIAECRNPEASREETHFDDNGKPISRTVTSRRTTGVQWLLERRFRQFRADWVPRPSESDVGDMLTAEQQAGFSPEAAMAVVRAMVASMPAELAGPFISWARARLPVGVTIDGNDQQQQSREG